MLTKKIIEKLYYQLLRIRMIEEAIANEYSKQEMRCPTHLSIGEEAIAVGVCSSLQKSDIVFSYHRSHGHYLAKGGDVKKMIAELYGKETGCSKGRGGSQHLIDKQAGFYGAIPIVGETIPLGVGVALAARLKKEKIVCTVFFGDGACEEGVLAESLNFASLKKLPVLFVCENNLYSILTPISARQPKRDIYKLAQGHAITSFIGDGNSVMAVYKYAMQAIKIIKSGSGPVFLEFTTYRYREHCGPNFEPEGFRPQDEYKMWQAKDPVKILEKYVLKKFILDIENIKKIKQKITKEIEAAFLFAKDSPFPEDAPSQKEVYA